MNENPTIIATVSSLEYRSFLTHEGVFMHRGKGSLATVMQNNENEM
jgi:hypothetical protein